MCFLTKCPYVPPHPFDIDIPHLILRYRAAERRAGEKDWFASSWARPTATASSPSPSLGSPTGRRRGRTRRCASSWKASRQIDASETAEGTIRGTAKIG
jgi:glycerol-3-phosphate dehydrogenase subunit C